MLLWHLSRYFEHVAVAFAREHARAPEREHTFERLISECAR